MGSDARVVLIRVKGLAHAKLILELTKLRVDVLTILLSEVVHLIVFCNKWTDEALLISRCFSLLMF